LSSPFDSSSTECPNRSAVHSLEPARHAHLTQVSRSSSLYCLPYTQTLSNLTTVAHSSYSSRLSSFPFLSSHLPSGQSSPVYRPPHLLSTTTAASVSNPTTRTVRYRLLSLRLRKGHLLVACSAVQCSAAQRSASHKQTLRLLNVVRFFRTTTFVAPPFVQPFSLHQGLFASEPRRPLHSFIIHSIYHHPIIKANLVVDPPVTASSPSVTHLTRLPVLPYSPQHRHRLRTQPSISTAAAIKLQRRLWTKKQQPSASTCQPSDALTATNKLPPRTLSLLCELIRRSLSTSRLIRHTLVIATL